MGLGLRVRSKVVTAGLLASVMALTGCDEAITVAPGAINKSDQCSRFQQALIDARREENALRVQNIAAGAIAGGVIGAILGGDNNREQGAIMGAILGGAIAGGQTAANQQAARDADAQALRDINTKAGAATQLYTKAGASAASLRTCRLNQLNALEKAIRAREVTIPTARNQLAVLRARATNDNRIISATFNGIGERVEDFVDAGAQTGGVERSIVTRQQAARTAQARTVRNATPNIPRARTAQAQVVNTDQLRREQIDRKFEAIDVLLG